MRRFSQCRVYGRTCVQIAYQLASYPQSSAHLSEWVVVESPVKTATLGSLEDGVMFTETSARTQWPRSSVQRTDHMARDTAKRESHASRLF